MDIRAHGPDDLPEDAFNTDETSGLEEYTFAENTKKELACLGITCHPRPILEEAHRGIFRDLAPGDYFDGRLPTVIRTLSLDQLSALHTLFCSWYSYLSFQTKLKAAEKAEAGAQKEFIWSHIRKQKKVDRATGRKLTDQEKSDSARIDFRFVKINARYEHLSSVHEALEAACKMADKDMRVVSREVTIVQTKIEQSSIGRGFSSRNAWGTYGEHRPPDPAPVRYSPKIHVKRGG